MRTALCLSGQARFINKNYRNILDSLVSPTEADVFCHFWDTAGRTESGAVLEPHRAIEVFRPAAYTLEPQRVFDRAAFAFVRAEYGANLKRYQDIHSMYYSIMKANQLKKEHESAHGFVYDCVIRSRTDITFEGSFDFSEFQQDQNTIWLRNLGRSPAGTSCADLFAFSNSELMDFYSNCFTKLPELLEKHQHLFAETLFYSYLTPERISLSKVRYSLVRD